jgi:ubiquitin-like protein Pup
MDGRRKAMSKQTPSKRTENQSPAAERADRQAPSIAKRGKEIDAAIDKLLDEIDDVLEENAEEFVKGYVQRGGE